MDLAGQKAVSVLSGYMVSTGALAAFGAISQAIIMWVLGLPLILPIAMLSFILGFIPYIGGAIAPGLELGLEALAARTAKLPRIELRAPSRAIGRDTVSAMQSGTVFGYQALVVGLLGRVRRELADLADVEPRDVKAILTGGLSAAPWATDLEGIDAIDPDLTLKGLAILHAEVSGGERLELGLP